VGLPPAAQRSRIHHHAVALGAQSLADTHLEGDAKRRTADVANRELDVEVLVAPPR
jgi:hypothetical protein